MGINERKDAFIAPKSASVSPNFLEVSNKSQTLSQAFNVIFSGEDPGSYLSRRPKTVRYASANRQNMEFMMRPKTSHSSLRQPLEIFIDGPFGAPSSGVFNNNVDHAVLIATGIGVTPFASILQSIMFKFWEARKKCPECRHTWSDGIHQATHGLKKVDFVWINREQRSFEWFLQMLSQLEMEQAELMRNSHQGHFLDVHLYMTSFSPSKNINAVALKLALDLMHKKVNIAFCTSICQSKLIF